MPLSRQQRNKWGLWLFYQDFKIKFTDVWVEPLFTRWPFLPVCFFLFPDKSIIWMLFDICQEVMWVWYILGPSLGWELFYLVFCVGGCHVTLERAFHIWQDISVYLISYSFSIISKGKGYNLNSAWEAVSTKAPFKPYRIKVFCLEIWPTTSHCFSFVLLTVYEKNTFFWEIFG